MTRMDVQQTEGVTPLSGYKFAHAISMGSNCYVSTVFKRLGLKRWSGPFDWMFTTVPMVRACIESDFEQLLDQRYFKPVVWQNKTEYKHTFYDTHWNANFTHHDPIADRAYYERCIGRFRDALRSDEPKLFLFVAQIHAVERARYVGEFERLTDSIAAWGKNSTVAGITAAMTGDDPGVVEAAAIGSSRLFHYTSVSPLQGVAFADAEDDRRIERFVLDLVGA